MARYAETSTDWERQLPRCSRKLSHKYTCHPSTPKETGIPTRLRERARTPRSTLALRHGH